MGCVSAIADADTDTDDVQLSVSADSPLPDGRVRRKAPVVSRASWPAV